MSDAELQYYYFGFYRILHRYRTLTLLGWGAVVAGCVGIFVGWEYYFPHGLLDIGISCSAIVAGLGLVHQSVVFLEEYLHFPGREHLGRQINGEPQPEVLLKMKSLMRIIDEGGWQEAYLAIRELPSIGRQFQLPPIR